MNIKNEMYVKYLSYLCLIVFFLLCGYACYVQRSITFDGARWFMGLADHGEFVIDTPHLRFSNIIVQIPAFIFARWEALDYNLLYSFYSFNFIYTFLPFLGLSFTSLYLFRNGKAYDLYFVILMYVVALLPSSAFPTNSISEAVVFFTPLYFYYQYGTRSTKFLVLLGVGTLYQTYSYPFSIFLIFALMISSFYKFKLKEISTNQFKVEFVILLTGFIVKLILNVRIFYITRLLPDQINFITTIKEAFTNQEQNITIFICFYSVLLLLAETIRKKINIFFMIIAVVIAVICLYRSEWYLFNGYPGDGFVFRSVVGPLVAIFSMLHTAHKVKKIKLKNHFIMDCSILFILLVNASKDFAISYNWNEQKKILRSISFNNTDCISISNAEFKKRYGNTDNITEFMISYHMFIDSLPDGKTKLLFIGRDENNLIKDVNHCHNYHPETHGLYFYFQEGHSPTAYVFNTKKGSPKNIKMDKKIFKLSELQSCEKPKLYLFEDHYVEIEPDLLPLNEEVQINFNLRSNDNEIANTSLRFEIGGKAIHEQKVEGDYKYYPIKIKKKSNKDLIKISFKEFKWFEDIYHPNHNYFILNCAPVKY